MQLTLVIVKSGSLISNACATVKSFRHEDIELKDIIFIDKLSDIDYGMIKSDWWIVLYDDEIVEPRLLEALTVASNYNDFDVFSFYKIDVDLRVTFCPRMFREHVRLCETHLYPVMPVRMEYLLDGWVLNHDCNACESKTIEDVSVQAG